jgi:hypothetical protein
MFQQETINTNYLFSFMSQEDCFSFHLSVILEISKGEPSRSLKAIIREASELSSITKTILLRRREDLVSCVTQDPKSVLENIFDVDVLLLSAAWPEGLEYLITTEASTLVDGLGYEPPSDERTPIFRAIKLDQTRSVQILLEAGCCLDTDILNVRQRLSISDRMATTIAAHMAERRAQLLKIAQQQLGLFLEHTSVAFADSLAAEICASLDEVGVPLHPSLRVQPDYQSIYLQGLVPLHAFNHFWEQGFQHFKSHNRIGFTPFMGRQYRLEKLVVSRNFNELMKIIYWLAEKGFMQERAVDLNELGLNVRATGYHYLGALLAHWPVRNICHFPFFNDVSQILKEPLMRQADEDDCMCWCNAEGHGCSPTKLFLVTCIHDVAETYMYSNYNNYKHMVLHHEVFEEVSENDKLSPLAKEALRLLTFEALEMTHTCCSLDQLDEHDHCDLMDEESSDDRGIFCHDPESILNIRSCTEEKSRVALLDELMAEFTEQLKRITAGPRAFEVFIYTYWRRRISELYTPSLNAMESLRQHQAFQGLGASPTVRTGELST